MEIQEYQKMYEQVKTHWWYRSRTRIVANALKKIYKMRNDHKILDLATAVGNNFENFDNSGRLYGIDISRESIKYCKEKGIDRIIRGDALRLPFKNGTFDLVLALDAFEHFENDLEVMREIQRVLKRGGHLVATVPSSMLLWSPHDEAFHHHRRYTTTQMANKLEKSGFTVKFLSSWTTFLMPLVYVFRKVKTILLRENDVRSDFHTNLPSFVERMFDTIQKLENFLLMKGVRFPFGVSLFCIAKKPSLLDE